MARDRCGGPSRNILPIPLSEDILSGRFKDVHKVLGDA